MEEEKLLVSDDSEKGGGRAVDDELSVLFERFFSAQTPEFRAEVRKKFCQVVTGSPDKCFALKMMFGIGLVAGVALQVLESTQNDAILSFVFEKDPPEA